MGKKKIILFFNESNLENRSPHVLLFYSTYLTICIYKLGVRIDMYMYVYSTHNLFSTLCKVSIYRNVKCNIKPIYVDVYIHMNLIVYVLRFYSVIYFKELILISQFLLCSGSFNFLVRNFRKNK